MRPDGRAGWGKFLLVAASCSLVCSGAWAFTAKTKAEIVAQAQRAMPTDLQDFLSNYQDHVRSGLQRASSVDPAALEPVAVVKELEKLTLAIQDKVPAPTVAEGFGRLAALACEVNMPLATARWGRDLTVKDAYETYIAAEPFYVRMPTAEYVPAPLDYLETASRRAREDDDLIRLVYWWSGGDFPDTLRTVTRRYLENAAKTVADLWYTVFSNAGSDLSALPPFAPEPTRQPAVAAESALVTEAYGEAFSAPLTLTFSHTPLADVIAYVSRQGGVQIVPQVPIPDEPVDVDLAGVPLIRALNIVLDRFGLYARAETENVAVIEPISTYDTVMLRSGYKITGRLIGYEDGRFRFQVDVGEVSISQSFVESIELSRSVGTYRPEAEATPARTPEQVAAGAEVARAEEVEGEAAAAEGEKEAEGSEAPAAPDFDAWLRAHPKWSSPDEEAVPWREAEKSIGRELLVQGRIVSTYRDQQRSVVLLNFDEDYVRHLKIVIFGSDLAKFPVRPESYYIDREVRVRGLVQDMGAGPEIVVTSPDQIEVARY